MTTASLRVLFITVAATAAGIGQRTVSADEVISLGLPQDRITAYETLARDLVWAIYGEDRGEEVLERLQACWNDVNSASNSLTAQLGLSLRLILEACDSEDRVGTMNRAVYDLVERLNQVEGACGREIEGVENDIGDGAAILAGDLQQSLSRMVRSLGSDGQSALQSLQSSFTTNVLPLVSFLPSLSDSTAEAQALRSSSNAQLTEILTESGAQPVITDALRDFLTAYTSYTDSLFLRQLQLAIDLAALTETELATNTDVSVAAGNIAANTVSMYSDYSREEIRTLSRRVSDIYALIVPYIDRLCNDLPPVVEGVAGLLRTYKDLIREVERAAFGGERK